MNYTPRFLTTFKDERPWQKSEGLIKVDVYGQRGRDLHFGDKVVLEGILSRPPALKNPGLFDYASYLRIKNIYSVLKVKELFIIKRVGKDSSNIVKRAAYVWRHKIKDSINKHFNRL